MKYFINKILSFAYCHHVKIDSGKHRLNSMVFSFLLLSFLSSFFITTAHAADIKSNQKGQVSLNNGSSSITVNLGNAVIDQYSMLLFTMTTDAVTSGPEHTHVLGELLCSSGSCNQIRFRRYASSGNMSISWSVLEYVSGVNVIRGTTDHTSMSGNPPKTTISMGVNTDKSFVILSELIHGFVTSNDDFTRGQINASGNLVLSTGEAKNSAGQGVVAWQVIEHDDVNVQHGDVSLAVSSTNRTVNINNVDLDKTWLVYNYYTTGTSSDNPVSQNLLQGRFIDNSTLEFSRGSSNHNGELHVTWYAISFDDGTYTQHGDATFNSSTLTKTATLSRTVDPACAVASLGGRGGKSTASVDHVSSGWFEAVVQPSGTEILLERGQTNSSTANLSWTVIEFPGCGNYQTLTNCLTIQSLDQTDSNSSNNQSCVDVAVQSNPSTSDSRLIAHWKFDEASGSSVEDITGNGHTGTLSGNPTWVAGKSGTALLFDSNSEHMDMPSSTDFSIPEFTIAMWVKWPNGMASGWHALLEYNRGTWDRKWYGVMTNGNMLRFVRPDSLDENLSTNTTDWYHISVSIDSSGNKKMYLNGALIDSSNNGQTIETVASVLRIGSNLYGGETANAMIDDVKFYNEVLTPTEIQAIADDTETTCTDTPITDSFDSDLTNWTETKFNSSSCGWSINNDRLKEVSGNCDGFLQYNNSSTPHNSEAGEYTLSIDVDANLSTTGNNGVGFVFNYVDDDNYYLIRWHDFSTNYSSESRYRYLQLIREQSGSDSTLDEQFIELPSNFTLKVVVNSTGIHTYIDDQLKLESTDTPLLKEFGLYADDNDGGIFYDNLNVNTCGSSSSTTNTIPKAVAEYRFDECSWNGTSGEVIDNSTNNLNGRSQSGASNTSSGKFYRAGQFDGSGDHVRIENDTKLQLTGDMTISLWVNPDKLSGRQGLIFKHYNNEFEIILESNGSTNYYHGDGSWERNLSTPSAAKISVNTWSHVVITRDHQNKELKWYIDGVYKGNETYTETPAASSNPTLIGMRSSSSAFGGKIDEVKFFDSVLSDTEIQTIFNNEDTGKNYDGTNRTAPSCSSSTANRSVAANTVDTNKNGTLTWRSTWVNNGIAEAPYVEITAEVPSGTVFMPIATGEFISDDGVYCEARGVSTGDGQCSYERPSKVFPQGRIIWRGLIAPENNTAITYPQLSESTQLETESNSKNGIEALPQNEIIIRFNSVPTGSEAIITGQAYSDWYFDGFTDSTLDLRVHANAPNTVDEDEQASITINKANYKTTSSLQSIPTVSEWGIIILTLLMSLMGLLMAHRRHV